MTSKLSANVPALPSIRSSAAVTVNIGVCATGGSAFSSSSVTIAGATVSVRPGRTLASTTVSLVDSAAAAVSSKSTEGL